MRCAIACRRLELTTTKWSEASEKIETEDRQRFLIPVERRASRPASLNQVDARRPSLHQDISSEAHLNAYTPGKTDASSQVVNPPRAAAGRCQEPEVHH